MCGGHGTRAGADMLGSEIWGVEDMGMLDSGTWGISGILETLGKSSFISEVLIHGTMSSNATVQSGIETCHRH